jgi:hypothetical protein
MDCKYKKRRIIIRKTIIAGIPLLLVISGTYAQFDGTVVPTLKASSSTIAWNVTINIVEFGGAGNAVVFGEADNASDGQDDYDLPVPPFPPQLPYLTAWFDTNLDYPYNKLWHEYKQFPDEYKQWNLSIMWMPEPGGESSTDIDISWDSSQLAGSGYKSVLLYEGNTVVVDMVTENSYEFKYPGGASYHFQIICQSEMSENNETPFLPLIFVFTTIMLFALYRKKK